jgi:integrase
MLGRGSGLLAIKEQLGHVYLDTTMRYIHSVPSRLQEEYKMHAPSYL